MFMVYTLLNLPHGGKYVYEFTSSSFDINDSLSLSAHYFCDTFTHSKVVVADEIVSLLPHCKISY